MRVGRELPWIVIVALFAGCRLGPAAEPPDAGPEPIRIDALEPASAWGGERIEVRGAGLGSPGEVVRVSFAGGAEAEATQPGDGTTLRILVPTTARTGPVTVIAARGQA